MKKSWILLVLAALLVVALAMPAAAADASTPHCYCGGTTAHLVDGCNGDVKQEWQPYEGGDGKSLPTESGFYYLTGDITNAETAAIRNVDIKLDLNGCTVTMRGDSRAYLLNGSAGEQTILTITDSKGTGSIKAAGTGDFVGAIIKTYTTVATVNIYGGTLDANGHVVSKTEEEDHGNGGAVIWNYGTVNMYGGTIKGGSVPTGGDGWGGGSVFLTGKKSKFNLYGGTITGGSANRGGNFYLHNNSQLNIYGGFIEEGTSTVTDMRHGGGNIYIMNDAKVNMTGGTIRNGHQGSGSGYGSGGNVCMRIGTFTMSGGIISNSTTETAGNYGGNIALTYHGCTFTMTGGTVTGGKVVSGGGSIAVTMNGGTVNIGGDAVVNGGVAKYGGAIWVGSGKKSQGIGTDIEGAVLKITGGTINGGTVTEGGSCIAVRDGNNGSAALPAKVTISDGTLDARNGSAQYGGAIDIDGTSTIDMSAGTIYGGPTTSAKTGGGAIIVQGGSVTMNGGTIYGGTAANGGAVLMNNSSTAGSFTMNGANAKIIGGTASNAGGVITVRNAAKTFTLTNGTIDGSTATALYGAAVSVSHGGNFVMEDGTLTGGSASGSCGGTISLEAGKVTIDGGAVNGGTLQDNAKFGGGTFAVIHEDAVMSISDGTIKAGTAKLGKCGYIRAGVLSITGGTVDSISKFGGTLNVSDAPTVTINLATNQSFSLPEALTEGAAVSYTCDLDGEVIAVGASQAIAESSTAFMDPYPKSLYSDAYGNIRLNCFLTYTNGKKGGHLVPSALAAGGTGTTYMILGDITTETLPELNEGTVIDLNGYTLTLTEATDLTGVILADSATADYDTTNGRGYGKIVATSLTGVPARSGVDTKTSYRYVTVFDGTNYSAHRIYMAVKSVALRPADNTIRYTAVLKCNEYVKSLITSYGATFTGTTTEFQECKDAITSGADGTNTMTVDVILDDPNFLANDFTGHATITLNDQWATAAEMEVTSAKKTANVKSIVEYADTVTSTYSTSINALVTFYNKYQTTMDTWNITNIKTAANKAGTNNT